MSAGSATGRTTLPTVPVTREPARSADVGTRGTSIRAAGRFRRGSRSDSGFWNNSDFDGGSRLRSAELPAGRPARAPVLAASSGCAARSTTEATGVGGTVGVRPSAACACPP
ncbi:hypothetical protein ACWD7F_10840 [Streptomyces sp. NPDC005122]